MSNGIEQNFGFGSFSFIDGDDKALDGVEVNENNQSVLTYTFTDADVGIKTFKGKYTGDGTQAAGDSNDFTVKVVTSDGSDTSRGQTPYVTKIVAGPGIYISPANGKGVVTISTKPINTTPVTDHLYDVSWTNSMESLGYIYSSDFGDNDGDIDDFFIQGKKGYFVAVGANGVTIVSGDGENWITLTPEASTRLQGVYVLSEDATDINYNRTIFFSVGATNGGTIVNLVGDENGWSQTFTLMGQQFGATTFYAVKTNARPDLFVGGGKLTGAGIFYNTFDTDGYFENTNWLEDDTTAVSAAVPNQFADDSDGGSSYKILSALAEFDPDNGNWTGLGFIISSDRTAGSTGTWDVVFETDEAVNGIATDKNGNWVAAGENGTVWTSNDTTTWTQVDVPMKANWNYIAYGNGKFVIVGKSSENKGAVIYSTDNGTTWTKGSGGKEQLYSIAYSPELNVFAAVGRNGSTLFVEG